MSEKEYTYQDVAEHNTKKDLFMVIHDKVYDCAKFVDEHPYVCCLACCLYLSYLSRFAGAGRTCANTPAPLH